MSDSFEKSFERAIEATKKQARTKPSFTKTGETAKVRVGAGGRVHIADIIEDTDKQGRPIKGVWVRCSKSGPTLWRADMAQPSSITRLPDDAPITCINCDPRARHEVRGPKSKLPIHEWKGLLGQLAHSVGGRMYTRPRTSRVKLRVPIGKGAQISTAAEEFRGPKRIVEVKETENP